MRIYATISSALWRLTPADLSLARLFIIFGLVVVFPTYIYKIVITYAMVRRRGVCSTCAPPLRNARLTPLAADPQWGRGGSGKNKLAMRVLVHPFICEVAMGILRNFARQMRGARGGMGSLIFVVLLVTRSIYGRFLLVRMCRLPGVHSMRSPADAPRVSAAPSPKRWQRHTAPSLHFAHGLHRAHVHQGHGCAVRVYCFCQTQNM